MEELYGVGFLGSRALFFEDVVVIYMALLPLLLGVSVWFAIKARYKTHRITQMLLLLLTLVALGSIQYDIHLYHTFDKLVDVSSYPSKEIFYLLMVQTFFSMLTFVMWSSNIIFAVADRKRRALPGLYSSSHIKSSRRLGVVIFLTVLLTIALYWILYID